MSSAIQHLLSGGLSGFATAVCLQPFDLLKTRVQQTDGRLPKVQDGRVHLRYTNSVIATARGVIVQDGVSGLWRGTTATLIRNAPGAALYMTSLNHIRTMMATSSVFATVRKDTTSIKGTTLPSLTKTGNLIAGATSRVAVGVIMNPFTVLKARYESNIYAYESLFSAFVSIVRAGPSALMRGVFASSLRDAPYAGLFVLTYETIKGEVSYLLPSNSSSHSAMVHSFSAASAGAIATMSTQPFDVIKTKIQVRNEERYHGLVRTAVTIWKQRGVWGFFDGASLRMSRKVLSGAIGWAVYEGILTHTRS